MDIVADCSDNLATRYLLSDACVLFGKVLEPGGSTAFRSHSNSKMLTHPASGQPLVSGASVGLEGYTTVYNHPTAAGKPGLCYRCLYPKPPPATSVRHCLRLVCFHRLRG